MNQALSLIAAAKASRASRLDLGNCGLRELPAALFELSDLEELMLSDEWLEYNPVKRRWERIESQNKGHANHITSLTGVEALGALKKLVADGEKWELKDLTPLAALIQLQSLNCANTKVRDLAPLAALTQLQVLNCASTQVRDLAPLAALTQLQVLNCANTQVSDLAPLAALTQVQSLFCSATQVSDLAPLAALTQLKLFYCYTTQVRDLAPLAALTQLQSLDCANTQVSDLAPLAALTQLLSLSCASTQVSDLAPLAALTQLQSLHCYDTQVSDLAPLEGLVNMYDLVIDGNSIKEKKDLKRLIQLPNIKELRIKNTPALNNPSLFSEDGHENVLAEAKTYLASLQGQSSIVYETKMILTGEGEVGKTSVRNKLVMGNGQFAAVPKKGSSTEGFELDSYQATIDVKGVPQKVIVNIWDLGGQDVQLPTHQFFMRHSSLYLFVFKSRFNDEQNRFEKWLYLIQKLSNNPRNPAAVCPVIGVMNQFDEQNKLASANYWLEAYKGQLKTFVTVNCTRLNDPGIENLKREIEQQLSNIEGFGKFEMNDDWIAVRNELKAISPQDKIISYTRYKRICEQKKVLDTLAQESLLNLLDKLGALLWYEDGVVHLSPSENEKLRNVVFLDHQWASQAIYQLLIDKNQLIDHEASMSFDELKLLWKGKYWDYHEHLILMMKRFGFCFETQDKNHFILTPLLTLIRHPEADAFKNQFYRATNKVLRLRLDYVDSNKEDIMPRALTARLIAIKHKDIFKCADEKRLYWRHGVALHNKRTDSRALIEENTKRGVIDITVSGEKAREYLGELLAAYDDLHDSLGGLRPNYLIPCNCLVCAHNPEPHYFEKEGELEERLKNGRDDIECKRKPFERVLIRPMISDVIDIDRTRGIEIGGHLGGHFDRMDLGGTGKDGDFFYIDNRGATIDTFGGKVVKPEEPKGTQTIDIPAPVLPPPPKPFFETHFGKSTIKGLIVLVIGAVAGSVLDYFIDFQFIWQTALVSGLFYFLLSFNNDPKYRFSRYAVWILGTWLVIGTILPNIEAWANIQNDVINGSIHFVSDNNVVLTIAALVLSGGLFWLDFKQNK
ncbi:MAG: leucine-rich repeat domain-containing protein [Haliscomenobacter sp.]|uniref:leucine-rich repeat domain-containing protein n=1 Tax=Haliscomenobacter sp. TaxID=2717303 RepID=UPI0029A7D91E|nr:leucine-rich repeat domain-containing protein [Haliscomenobacter sp.]MDX2069888.1 leucine-rich repeat domain-containing protein [Haliscomenobacter sp.]